MARKPDTPCAGCGTLMWSGSTSLPAGVATCRQCRNQGLGVRRVASSTKTCAVCACILVGASKPQGEAMCGRCHRTPCATCGAPSTGLRCRPCHVAVTRDGATGKNLAARRALDRRRKARMTQAPGLTIQGLRDLLATWKRQARRCTYCPDLANTVDHVIPLALGGTNREGNLTPACRACNSRKNDSLLIEWRHKRRTRRERVAVVVTPPTPRVVKGKTKRVCFPHCQRCDGLFTARTSAKRFCSERCMRGKPETHSCGDCGVEVPRTRNKCDACLLLAKRERKRRYKRGLRARRRLERTLIAA